MERRHAYSRDRLGPTDQLAEVVATQPGTLRAGEDQRVRLLPDVLRQVSAEQRHKRRREGDEPPPGPRLGRTLGDAAGHLDLSPLDPDRRRGEVQVGPPERRQLAPPQTPVRREQDQRDQSRRHPPGQLGDLRRRQRGSLGRMLLIGALDPARIPPDHIVVDRGMQHCPEQPVRLRRDADRHASGEQLGAPCPDARRLVVDHRKRHADEVRRDVKAEKPLVQLDRPGA
ncbi:MAG: hypothetical protein ACJ73E_15480 [Mycobacteriales bacterium]